MVSPLPELTSVPKRVISLVPSVTASLFDLNLSSALIGVTDYCVYPPVIPKSIMRLGGPKTLNLSNIIALQPDLIIANKEENSREEICSLIDCGFTVWLTFPQSVRAALDDLWALVRVFRSKGAEQTVITIEKTLEWHLWAQENSCKKFIYFCPIWLDKNSDPLRLMTFNRLTYSNDLLSLLGGINIFSDRQQSFSPSTNANMQSKADTCLESVRYPYVSIEDIVSSQPDTLLMLDEPYLFNSQEEQILINLFAKKTTRKSIHVIRAKGSLVHWPGTFLAKALSELPGVLY